MITTITTFSIGFSVIIGPLLFISYLLFLKSDSKTLSSIIFCGLFLFAVTALQLEHFLFISENAEPLNTQYYRFLLFFVPPMFYFFSRFVLFPDYKINPLSLIHFLPIISVFLVDRQIAVPAAFIIGSGYCLWLLKMIYSVRKHRNRFEVEFFFFAFFSLLAIAVLILGFAVSFIDDAYFYYFYANGLTIAYILVTAALIIYPDLLNDLTEVVKLSYSTTTLSNVNLSEKLQRLDHLMLQSKLYQNEELNLSTLADAMEMTGHQLSELINTHFNVNFSKYIRQIRVEQAKILLISEPKSSILSISMESGFKSQSNFYAAFKEIAGISPGNFRNQ